MEGRRYSRGLGKARSVQSSNDAGARTVSIAELAIGNCPQTVHERPSVGPQNAEIRAAWIETLPTAERTSQWEDYLAVPRETTRKHSATADWNWIS